MTPKPITAALAAALACGGATALETDKNAQPQRRGVAAPPYVVIHEGVDTGTLYTTGEKVTGEAESVWRPVCAGPPGAMSREMLLAAIDGHERAVRAEQAPIVVDSGVRGAGIDFVFTLLGNVPADAPAAVAIAETFLESQFGDPITIDITMSFQNLGGGVLGATSSNYFTTLYSDYRDGLIADMDADDVMQAFLPAGSTIPVRYDASSASVTNENRVFLTRAVYRAAVGSLGGAAASMTYNSAFAWDWNPANGVPGSQFSFVDVVIHEVGHAMGFASGVDFRTNDIEAIDIARFQRTDGAGDYNPDTNAEFGTTPRTVDFNNLNDDANTDLIFAEHRMSDGDPWQASHFREQSSNIGIMDPAFSNGQTFIGRGYYSAADLNVFDFIGYDYPACVEPGFLTQPGDDSACAGGTVVLFSQALVNADYQWRKDGVNLVNGGDISGATSAILTINNLSAADEGVYTVEITAIADGCTAVSNGANVTVGDAPIIALQPPATVDATEGDDVVLFAASQIGNTFQWRKNGVNLNNGGNISGATSSTLTISNATPADDGFYDFVLTSPEGCTSESDGTLVTIEPAADPCPADCDGNGLLNVDDIDCFATAFFGSNLAQADCDGNGLLNVDDIDCFATAFFAGCP